MRRPKSEIRASDTLVDATLSAIADAGSTPAVSTNQAAPKGAADFTREVCGCRPLDMRVLVCYCQLRQPPVCQLRALSRFALLITLEMSHKYFRSDFAVKSLLAMLLSCGLLLTSASSASAAAQPIASGLGSGGNFFCVVMSDTTVQCWGNNGKGQLGNGTTTNYWQATSVYNNAWIGVTVTGLSGVSQLSGQGSTGSNTDGSICASLSDTTVKCWGNNSLGQLGDGTTTNSTTPVSVSGLSGATQVTAGQVHYCALLSDTTVKCWGNSDNGELGNGTQYTNSVTPVMVTGLSGATQITSGYQHSCARLSDTTVKCWGANTWGQIGDGTGGALVVRTTPVSVTGLSQVSKISAGGATTCALLTDATVKCWGMNDAGQVGDGTTTQRTTPQTVSGLSGVVQLTGGAGHMCALLTDTSVKCWGGNSYGQLGNGTTTSSSSPVAVTGLSNVTQLASSDYTTCALLTGGDVKCWGDIARRDTFWSGGIVSSSRGARSTTPVLAYHQPDTTPPATPGPFTGEPSSTTSSTGATISFTLGEAGGTVECRVDSGSWGPCTSVSGTTGSFTVSGLADGAHTVSVRQTDAAGNVSAVGTSSSWTVASADTVAPDAPAVTLISPSSSPTSDTTASISYSGEGGAIFTCSLDGGAFGACPASPVALSGLSLGDHTYSVKATDSAGNVSPAGSVTWTVVAAARAPGLLAVSLSVPAFNCKAMIKCGTQFVTTIKSTPKIVGGPVTKLEYAITDKQPSDAARPFAGRVLAYSPVIKLPPRKVAFWVRVRNDAGLWSRWYRTRSAPTLVGW